MKNTNYLILFSKLNSVVKAKAFAMALIALTILLTSCANQSNEATQSFSLSGKGIVNGTRIIKRNADKFASILRLSIDGKGLCTGTYLGNGYVLTAYHCVGLNHKLDSKDKPTIHLSSTAGLKTSRASKIEELEVFVPPTDKKVQVGGGIKIPLPDLVVLKFLGEFEKELEGTPAAKIGKDALKLEDKEVLIAGYGNDQFDRAVSAVGLLNFGSVKLETIDELLLKSVYKEGEKFSAILPGDSGGPLFKFDNQDLVVYGVASSVGYDRFEVAIEGTATEARFKHSRTDTESVREWIDCILSQLF